MKVVVLYEKQKEDAEKRVKFLQALSIDAVAYGITPIDGDTGKVSLEAIKFVVDKLLYGIPGTRIVAVEPSVTAMLDRIDCTPASMAELIDSCTLKVINNAEVTGNDMMTYRMESNTPETTTTAKDYIDGLINMLTDKCTVINATIGTAKGCDE